jgi:hypothetical protein
MTDRTLFDPDRTTDAVCILCGATREPGQDKAPLCLHDRDSLEYGIHSRRPTKCLNAHDPAHAPFPEGF